MKLYTATNIIESILTQIYHGRKVIKHQFATYAKTYPHHETSYEIS